MSGRVPWFSGLLRPWRDRRRIARTLRREHVLSETLRDYEGKWVVVSDSEIVASADTLYELQFCDTPSDASVFQVVSGPCFFRAATSHPEPREPA